jgi:PAS domain S-box-containing protein
VARANDAVWFRTVPERSVLDFFDLCDLSPDGFMTAVRTLERLGGALPTGGTEPYVAELRKLMEHARAGDWQPLEHHLSDLGASHAHTDLSPSAWYEIAASFYNVIAPRAVERFAAEPARLAQLLVAVGEYLERSLTLVAGAYHAVKQQRLREITARYGRIIDAALDAVVEIDHEGMVSEWNPVAEQMFGYAKREAIGTSLADRIVPLRYRGRHRAGVSRLFATNEARIAGQRVELTACRADGSEFPVELALIASDRADGSRSVLGVLRDLTEQKRTDESLARSARRLEILSNTAHEFAAASGAIDDLLALASRRLGEIIGDACAIRMISSDGHWLEPNASFHHSDPETAAFARQVLGSERQRVGEGLAGQVAASGCARLIPEIATEQFIDLTPPAFRSMLARVRIASALAIPLRAHERTIGVISLWRTQPGNPYTIDDQRFAQDLADRAGLAIDNAALVATLEERVTQRTAALEAANHELEAFSYTVSHDLRSPLRAIDGFSQILLSDYEAVLDPSAHHYLHRIRSGTQRMASIIDDLLHLARISRQPLNLAVHDISALAAEVAAELRRQDPERAIQIEIAPGLVARADSHLLRIVLENLFGNAWKFTAKHPGAGIWFGGDAGTFHVRDTGAGFDMTYSQKLFAPFQRLHAVKEYDGTGIGLAIVHRIITHHGGRIWAEAEVGKGATFFFTLEGTHGRLA